MNRHTALHSINGIKKCWKYLFFFSFWLKGEQKAGSSKNSAQGRIRKRRRTNKRENGWFQQTIPWFIISGRYTRGTRNINPLWTKELNTTCHKLSVLFSLESGAVNPKEVSQVCSNRSARPLACYTFSTWAFSPS